jgi:PBS lyase HEAT-like repeat
MGNERDGPGRLLAGWVREHPGVAALGVFAVAAGVAVLLAVIFRQSVAGLSAGVVLLVPSLFLAYLAVPIARGTQGEASPAGASNRATSSSGNQFGTAVSAYVEADIDLDVLVDGELALRLDHSRGLDYVAATIIVRPDSVITFRAPGLSIDRRASQIVDAEKKLKVKVGTGTQANIPITKEQRRAAMGTPNDVPSLIEVLMHSTHYSARAWAATRLGAIGDRRAAAPLIAVVDSVRPDQDDSIEWVQANAALALAELGDPAGAPAIQRALDQLPNQNHHAHSFKAALRDLSAAS